jgi:YidC/Oxa1 family membrane protein insertase
VYWITSNLVTLGQNFVIYNYGPGKKTSDGKKGKDTGKSKANDGGARETEGEQTQERSQEEIAKQAAKVAKRKRRKKKK